MKEPFSAEDFLEAYHNDEPRLRRYLGIMEKDWRPFIIKEVTAMNGSEQDADDVFQESIYELVANLGAGNFKQKSTLRTYFTTICKYKWMGRRRKDTRREEIRQEVFGSTEQADAGENIVDHEELSTMLSGLLTELGDKCKQILTLWGQGLSYNEIVEQLDTDNPGTARKRKHDCIEKLTGLVEQRPGLKQRLQEYLTI